MPIMFLTAMDEETDIIMGWISAAMTISQKPFSWRCLCRESMPPLRRSDNFNQADTELNSNGIRVQLLKARSI